MVSNLINQYPDTFAVVEYYVQDAPYSQPWGESRGYFYNIWSDGIPWFAYDGLFDAWPISTYHSKLNQRQAVTTDVTMELAGEHVSGDTYRIIAHFRIEDAGQAKTMRLYMVQCLDRWPASSSYARNTFKQAATTEDVTLAPGESVRFTASEMGLSFASQGEIGLFDGKTVSGVIDLLYYGQLPSGQIYARAEDSDASWQVR